MPTTRPTPPPIIAHRGNAADFPENTLPAILSALQLGVRFIEFDIQLTADRHPILLHDNTFTRTATRTATPNANPASTTAPTATNTTISDLPLADAARIPVGHPAKFADRFPTTCAPTLAQAVDLLTNHPAANAFVELKPHALTRFGAADSVARVLADLAPIRDRCILISSDTDALSAARAATQNNLPVGWVLSAYDNTTRRQAEQLKPAYLFVNTKRIPPDQNLWPPPHNTAPWQWALYEISDPDHAPQWARRGAAFVETMSVRRFTQHDLYKNTTHP